MEFYTQNGWCGSNYKTDLSIKDICKEIRSFAKRFDGFKFSIRKSCYKTIYVTLKKSPVEITNSKMMYDYFEENFSSCFWIEKKGNVCWYDLTESEKQSIAEEQAERRTKYCQLHGRIDKRDIWINPEVAEVLNAIQGFAYSFNYDDSDSQIDYFDTNFYLYLEIETEEK